MDLDQIITEGIGAEASDIHFIPFGHEVKIYFRKCETLEFTHKTSRQEFQILLQKAKAMGQMNISEKRLPQDGILKINDSSVRISTLRSIQGESLVLRLFQKELITYENIGLSAYDQSELLKKIAEMTGIFLISGETGMGKSTTMYALMMKLRDLNHKVISIEDPVEREVEGIVQSQINEAAGYGYEKAIFAALRQDPDYICIGEIRSGETAEALIRAALTGHRVISTIHSGSFMSTFRRMTEFGIDENYLKPCLRMVMNQKLIRTGGRRKVDAVIEYAEDQSDDKKTDDQKNKI